MKYPLRRFAMVAVGATTLLMFSGGLHLVAQEPGAPKARLKKAFDPTRRVPMYFGQLGLTNEQRESIYAIQAKQMPKIEALDKQIEELRAQIMKDCEAALTPAQKELLDRRRTGVAEARSKKAAPPAKP
jgi:Spy/CpxP family protein refolding chaperone